MIIITGPVVVGDGLFGDFRVHGEGATAVRNGCFGFVSADGKSTGRFEFTYSDDNARVPPIVRPYCADNVDDHARFRGRPF